MSESAKEIMDRMFPSGQFSMNLSERASCSGCGDISARLEDIDLQIEQLDETTGAAIFGGPCPKCGEAVTLKGKVRAVRKRKKKKAPDLRLVRDTDEEE